MLVPPKIWMRGKKLPQAVPICSGKLTGPSLEGTSDHGQPKRLFLVDKSTGLCFLIDTGAEISIVPPQTSQERNRPPGKMKLFAANGASIPTFGEILLQVNLNLRRSLPCHS
ncbi:hypothetical protein JTE90_006043 [Oedothorax gibbosus]|uniref:Peptidase A2 domain-containing protein n=1 Tax=Oedothorax gibbosus TaxID=931172 RepID=A0AAV6TRS0_9ARAC|nr:hypothetical protein JTE90_006043 [Oedothorax gibbosus]